MIFVSNEDKAEEKVSLLLTGTGAVLTRNFEDTQCLFPSQELPSSTPVSEPPLRVFRMKVVLTGRGGQSREHLAHADAQVHGTTEDTPKDDERGVWCHCGNSFKREWQ